MILKPLSSLILVLALAAASPVHAAIVEPSVATTAIAAPSTANLDPSRSTSMAKAITPAAVDSFASSQVSSHPNSKDPTGPSSMRKVSGRPSLLKIEIDELEIGGLAVPFVQTSLQNSKSGFKNFGNADLVAPNSGPDDEARSSGAENEQAGQVVEYT